MVVAGMRITALDVLRACFGRCSPVDGAQSDGNCVGNSDGKPSPWVNEGDADVGREGENATHLRATDCHDAWRGTGLDYVLCPASEDPAVLLVYQGTANSSGATPTDGQCLATSLQLPAAFIPEDGLDGNPLAATYGRCNGLRLSAVHASASLRSLLGVPHATAYEALLGALLRGEPLLAAALTDAFLMLLDQAAAGAAGPGSGAAGAEGDVGGGSLACPKPPIVVQHPVCGLSEDDGPRGLAQQQPQPARVVAAPHMMIAVELHPLLIRLCGDEAPGQQLGSGGSAGGPGSGGELLAAVVLRYRALGDSRGPQGSHQLITHVQRCMATLAALPSILTLVSFNDRGRVLFQNAASVRYMGLRPCGQAAAATEGQLGAQTHKRLGAGAIAGRGAWGADQVDAAQQASGDGSGRGRCGAGGGVGGGGGGVTGNASLLRMPSSPLSGGLLEELFALCPHLMEELQAELAAGRSWTGIVEVPALLLRPPGPYHGLPWLGTGSAAAVVPAVRCTWESISAQPHALAPSPHTPPAPQRPHAQPRTAMQKQQEQSDLTRENTQRSRQSDNSAALITLDCNNLAIMSVTTDQVADYATATGRHVRMRLSGAGPLSSGSSCCTSPFVAPAAPLSEDSSPQPTISLRPAASAALPAVAPMPYASLRPGGSEHQLPMAVSQAGGQSTVPVLQQGVSEQMYRRTLRQAPRREDSMGTLTQRQGSYALIRRSALGALGSPLSPEASEVAANALRTSTWGLLHTRRRLDLLASADAAGGTSRTPPINPRVAARALGPAGRRLTVTGLQSGGDAGAAGDPASPRNSLGSRTSGGSAPGGDGFRLLPSLRLSFNRKNQTAAEELGRRGGGRQTPRSRPHSSRFLSLVIGSSTSPHVRRQQASPPIADRARPRSALSVPRPDGYSSPPAKYSTSLLGLRPFTSPTGAMPTVSSTGSLLGLHASSGPSVSSSVRPGPILTKRPSMTTSAHGARGSLSNLPELETCFTTHSSVEVQPTQQEAVAAAAAGNNTASGGGAGVAGGTVSQPQVLPGQWLESQPSLGAKEGSCQGLGDLEEADHVVRHVRLLGGGMARNAGSAVVSPGREGGCAPQGGSRTAGSQLWERNMTGEVAEASVLTSAFAGLEELAERSEEGRDSRGEGKAPHAAGEAGPGEDEGHWACNYSRGGGGLGGDSREGGTRWHEVLVSLVPAPAAGGERVLLVKQTDVTARVLAERRIAEVLEAEHKLLESVFPRHVLELAAANARRLGPDAATPNGGGVSQYRLAQLPLAQDCDGLATDHPLVTILFADIVGFTSMCNEIPATAVMAFLNHLYSRLDTLLDVYGVYKVETIGDCYMVAGGLMTRDAEGFTTVRGPGSMDELHAAKVLAFAKAMLREAAGVRLPTSGQPVQMRIGLHSGPVTSGIVGSKMPRFCLFGDTVNTASRMESTCPPGSIHVSAATRSFLPDDEWEPTGGVEVKGKGRMETYTLTPLAVAPRTATSGCGAVGSDLRRQSAASSKARGDPHPLWSPQHVPSSSRTRRASVATCHGVMKARQLSSGGSPVRGPQTHHRRASAIADCAVAGFGSGLSASSSFAGVRSCEKVQPVDVGALVRAASSNRAGGQGAAEAAAEAGAGGAAGAEGKAGGVLSGSGTGPGSWWATTASAPEGPSGTSSVERVAKLGGIAGKKSAGVAGAEAGSGGAGLHLPTAAMQEWAHVSVSVRDEPVQLAGLGSGRGGVDKGHVAHPVRRSRSSGTLGV